MNKAKIKAAMAMNDDNQEKLAEALGLQKSGVSARINGKIDFRASEIAKIIKRYNLTEHEAAAIFFDEVAS